MAFIKFFLMGFLALSVIYLCVSLYSRSVRREKLEDEWDENPPEGATPDARAQFITDGMAAYRNGLRVKLIALVYVVPTIVVVAILFIINAN